MFVMKSQSHQARQNTEHMFQKAGKKATDFEFFKLKQNSLYASLLKKMQSCGIFFSQ